MFKRRIPSTLVLAALALTAAHCKKGAETGSGGSGTVTEADFESGLAADHCARVASCCSAAMQSFDEALCEKQFRAATFPTSGATGGTGGSGGASGGSADTATVFDGAAAGACLAGLESKPASCASLFPTADAMPPPTGGPIVQSDACSKVLHGTKKVGEACTTSLECAPSEKGYAYCNPSLHGAGAPSMMGTCQQVDAILGGQCGDQSMGMDATKPFYLCVPEGGGGKVFPCENGFCNKVWHEGDWCHDFSDGKCEAGLQCMNDVCTGQPAAGQPCPNGACAAGAYCNGGTCAAQKGVGEACMSANECAPPANDCSGGKCAVPAAQMCTMGH